ncbi:MAG TPA: LysM peptidoglycan-binding domain-containing protein [Spirochaetes bacterium]|nr:LysM peptidoglycan-binding domain-containing protein [Spirochaetota bacterium]
MPRRNLYGAAGAVAAFCITTLFIVLSLVRGAAPAASTENIHELFASEDEYLNHVKAEVRFRDLKLSVVEIKKGDNFWKIARDHNVNIDTLLGANPYWNDVLARVNQRVVVPSRVGVLHFIYDLSQVEDIARSYDLSPDAVIVQDLPLFYRLYYRFRKDRRPLAVFVPDARPSSDTMTDEMARKFALREMFRSPLAGRFSSFFGGRNHPIFRRHSFHNGIDIAAPHGTPVGASCEGVVSSTGWMGGYGIAVIIDHPRGYRTLYGHLSKVYVRPGQKIHAGRLIGRVGSTGWSTGPHLHFTLWHNGRLINPMKVLW